MIFFASFENTLSRILDVLWSAQEPEQMVDEYRSQCISVINYFLETSVYSYMEYNEFWVKIKLI